MAVKSAYCDRFLEGSRFGAYLHAAALRVLDPPLELDPIAFVLSWHRRNDGHPAQRWFRDCITSLPADADTPDAREPSPFSA